MIRRAAGPIGLLGRILAILLMTVLIEFGVSTVMYERASSASLHEDEAHRLAEHLVVTRKLIADSSWGERQALAQLTSTERYGIHWRSTEPPRQLMSPDLVSMTRQVVAWEPDLANSGLNLRLFTEGSRQVVSGSLRMPDGSWLEFRMREPGEVWDLTINRILLALVPAVGLIIIGSMLIRSTLRPLRSLVQATHEIGYGESVHVEEAGVAEVRALIRAYNAMQDRIHQLVEDRTQALAAVGHDLRTPVARLQLRAEGIDRPDLRRDISGDLAEIEAMLASLMAFLSGENDPEVPSRTDLAVMAQTIAEDYEDRGFAVTYRGPDHREAVVRVVGMRRALANLVENAINYGHRADVVLSYCADGLTIAVEDDGPGIPPDKIADVIHPFVRIDASRARNTQGLGLGLSIVAQAMEREGGELRLINRSTGGLSAQLWLPAK